MRKTKLMVALGLTVLTLASVTGCACQKGDSPQNVTQQVNTTASESADIVSKFNEVFKDYVIQNAAETPSLKSMIKNYSDNDTLIIASDNADINVATKFYMLGLFKNARENTVALQKAGQKMNSTLESQFGAPVSKQNIDENEVTWYQVSADSQTYYVCAVVTKDGFIEAVDTSEKEIVDNMNKLGIKVK